MRALRAAGTASMVVVMALAGTDVLAQVQPVTPAPARRSAAPVPAQQQTTQSTQTTTSDADAGAEANASVSVQWIIGDPWFDSDQWPGQDGPGTPPAMPSLAEWMRRFQVASSGPGTSPAFSPSIGPRPEVRTWHDPREEPMPSGVMVGAFAHAEAHSGSRARSTSASSPHSAASQQSRSTSKSRAIATAQAQIMIAPGFKPGPSSDQPRVETLSPQRQLRAEALTTLSRQSDWRVGLARLGQTYLDHPELLAVDLTRDNPELDAEQVRAMLTKAQLAAAQSQRAVEWVGVSVLTHAEGRADSSEQALAKIAPANDHERDRVDQFARSLRQQNRIDRSR